MNTTIQEVVAQRAGLTEKLTRQIEQVASTFRALTEATGELRQAVYQQHDRASIHGLDSLPDQVKMLVDWKLFLEPKGMDVNLFKEISIQNTNALSMEANKNGK